MWTNEGFLITFEQIADILYYGYYSVIFAMFGYVCYKTFKHAKRLGVKGIIKELTEE